MPDFSSRDTLTPGDRIMALVKGRPLDRVPFNPCALGLSARLFGIDRGQFYRRPEAAFAAGRHLAERYPWMNTRPTYGWADRGSWEFGGKIIWPDQNRYIAPLSSPVISGPEQVDELPVPDPRSAGMNPLVARFNDLSRPHGLAAALPGASPTTLSAAITGRTTFLTWLLQFPDAVHRLQRKATDFILDTARTTIARHGARHCSAYCGFPMESNQLISPAMFARFAKPYIEEVLDAYRRWGVGTVTIHLCGDHGPNMVHWADMPLGPRTVFSIGSEMDLKRTGEQIGPDHILAGNLKSAVLQFGSTAEVYADTCQCLHGGKGHSGGFILMPSCEIPPDTPTENLEAVARALFDHGYYD